MKRRPNILLVHPPIYDFTAYDFWLKPYGLLRVAGMLRGRARMSLFDYADRAAPGGAAGESDAWGRGKFPAEAVPTPAPLAEVRRRFHRFGRPREAFAAFIARRGPFDAALVQTGMTYWYPGVREVIDDLRRLTPDTKIILGGVYATLCGAHARTLGADAVVAGPAGRGLWDELGLVGDPTQPALWEAVERIDAGVLKLTDGCPFHCTYCAVHQMAPDFAVRPLELVLAEWEMLIERGAADIAFYDDALLHRPDQALTPLLREAGRRGLLGRARLHTPNALNARFLTPAIAEAMVEAGFRSFFLGFESTDDDWQKQTGGKVASAELAAAVEALRAAGADPNAVTAYLILGHPNTNAQRLAASMRFVHSLGIRIALADFSPLPGTPDGDACRTVADLDEPLWHNKTAFTLRRLGPGQVHELKALRKTLNGSLPAP